MFFQPVADVAGPPVAAAAGVDVLVLVIPVLLVEAALLFFLKWGSLRDSFLASLAMNFISTVVGFLLIGLNPGLWQDLLVGLVLSVALEGGVMLLFRKASPRQTWLAALVANLVSYLGLALVAWVTGGLS
jgi:hypothetical protein